jgi:hypothetical protein
VSPNTPWKIKQKEHNERDPLDRHQILRPGPKQIQPGGLERLSTEISVIPDGGRTDHPCRQSIDIDGYHSAKNAAPPPSESPAGYQEDDCHQDGTMTLEVLAECRLKMTQGLNARSNPELPALSFFGFEIQGPEMYDRGDIPETPFRLRNFVSGGRALAKSIRFMQEAELMKKKAAGILILALIATFAAAYSWAQGAKKAAPSTAEPKIVVFNPRGIQPDIRKIPMATRPATLDGKTVYIVDTKYPNTKPFVNELLNALKAKYPKVNWIVRDKYAGYMDDDPNLWKEIKEKGAASIVLVGH